MSVMCPAGHIQPGSAGHGRETFPVRGISWLSVYGEMENYHREKEQSINFKANDKHIYLFPCKAKDVVQTLQEDVSMVFLLLPCPSDT